MVFYASQVWAIGGGIRYYRHTFVVVDKPFILYRSKKILEVINLQSFSSLWYWVLIAVLWSTIINWMMVVPSDMIHRARKTGGQAAKDLADLVRINVNRQQNVATITGLLLLGLSCFMLTTMAVLGFMYGVQLAQAIFLLTFPLSIIGVMTLSTGRLIVATHPKGENLYRLLLRQRLWMQIVGTITIFVTALYGMYQNLTVIHWL